MTNDSKFNDARASLKDLAKKVETIDLSGSGLVGGKRTKGTKRTSKRKSASPKRKSSKSRSASPKRKSSRSTSVKRRSGSAKKKSTSGSKKAKTTMSVNEHKLADNLIQLGVQLKNMQLDGGKRKGRKSSKTRKTSAHRKAHKPLHM